MAASDCSTTRVREALYASRRVILVLCPGTCSLFLRILYESAQGVSIHGGDNRARKYSASVVANGTAILATAAIKHL